jgi:hypothetical protein
MNDVAFIGLLAERYLSPRRLHSAVRLFEFIDSLLTLQNVREELFGGESRSVHWSHLPAMTAEPRGWSSPEYFTKALGVISVILPGFTVTFESQQRRRAYGTA